MANHVGDGFGQARRRQPAFRSLRIMGACRG